MEVDEPSREEDAPQRPVANLTPEQVNAAMCDLLALVDERLPERFYRGEGRWRPLGAAMIARMSDLVDSMRLLIPSRRQSDVLILLRALYEHMVTFCWVAIDPDVNTQTWINHSWIERKKLHNDLIAFGIDDLMSESELERAKTLKVMPSIDQRAKAVDAYWPAQVRGSDHQRTSSRSAASTPPSTARQARRLTRR